MADDPNMPAGSRKKFTPTGESKTYLGHSVIAKLSLDSPLRTTLKKIHAALAAHELRDSIFPGKCLLPPETWHMTVFICVRDRERGAEVMPRVGEDAEAAIAEIKLDGPYEKWLEYTKQRVDELSETLPEEAEPPYVMTVEREIREIGNSICLNLVPTGDKLWAVRNELAVATGIQKNDFGEDGYDDTYKFHVTLAYTVKEPEPADAAELKAFVEGMVAEAPATAEFSKVALCSFEDMQAFKEEVVLADADAIEEDDDSDDNDVDDDDDDDDDDTDEDSSEEEEEDDDDDYDDSGNEAEDRRSNNQSRQ